jgi:iron complex transport system permease protein
MGHKKKWVMQLAVVLAAWAAAFAASLWIGPLSHSEFPVIIQLRLPRALLATSVGISLAVAGSVLQALFTNPLCDPYTLGISSGAALGAVLAATAGLSLVWAGVLLPALIGALLFGGILQLLANRAGQGKLAILLLGTAFGIFGSGLVSLWISVTEPNRTQNILFWLLGDLSRARLESASVSVIITILLSLVLWSRAHELDALLTGEESAASLGIDLVRSRQRLLFLSSMLVAVAVSSAGMVGFIGLVVPHLARRWVGHLHARSLPIAAGLGAVILILADTIARTAIRPYELPVGVISVLFGAPVFAWMIFRHRSEL